MKAIRKDIMLGLIGIFITIVSFEGSASAEGGGRFGNHSDPQTDELMEIEKDKTKHERLPKIDSEIETLQLAKRARLLNESYTEDLELKEENLRLEKQFLSRRSYDSKKYIRLKEVLNSREQLQTTLIDTDLAIRVLNLSKTSGSDRQKLLKEKSYIQNRQNLLANEVAELMKYEEPQPRLSQSTPQLMSEIPQAVSVPPLAQNSSSNTSLGQQVYPNGLTGASPRYSTVYIYNGGGNSVPTKASYPTYHAAGPVSYPVVRVAGSGK